MTDEAAEAIDRRSSHCMTAGFLTAIILLALWGLASPWSIVSIAAMELPADLTFGIFDFEPAIGSWLVSLGLVLGGMVSGWYGWAMLAQRRRPWPFGPRHQERLVSRWPLRVVPFLVAFISARILSDSLRDWAGLSFPPIDGYWVRVDAVPVDAAITYIIWLLVMAIVAIPTLMFVKAMLRQAYPDEAPLRIVESPGS